MYRYQSTRAVRRKWLSINTQVSWKLASFLSSTDLLGQWVHSSAPSEVHRSWIMTLLFRAGLSPSETLHYFGTQDESSTHLEGTSTGCSLIYSHQSCVMSSASHETAAHVQSKKCRCPVRHGSWIDFLYGQSPEEGRSYVHNI